MRRLHQTLALGIALTGSGILAKQLPAQPPAATASTPEWQSVLEPREYSDEQGKTLKYRLMKPLDYHPNKKYPLVVFLHGAGERGDDNVAQLKHGIKNFAAEEHRKQHPCFLLVPQCPAEEKWVNVDWSSTKSEMPAEPSQALRLTMAVVQNMIESSGVDRTRIYVTGLSMGGYGTWDALARYPELIAAAAPVCGGGDPSQVEKFASIPIWAFHGGKDEVVRPERSRQMIEALKKIGVEAKYTEYESAGHDSWTATYADPTFHQWLFAQRRKTENGIR